VLIASIENAAAAILQQAGDVLRLINGNYKILSIIQ
jgi:hypothetical protein